jgi:hypothetical protein
MKSEVTGDAAGSETATRAVGSVRHRKQRVKRIGFRSSQVFVYVLHPFTHLSLSLTSLSTQSRLICWMKHPVHFAPCQ